MADEPEPNWIMIMFCIMLSVIFFEWALDIGRTVRERKEQCIKECSEINALGNVTCVC